MLLMLLLLPPPRLRLRRVWQQYTVQIVYNICAF